MSISTASGDGGGPQLIFKVNSSAKEMVEKALLNIEFLYLRENLYFYSNFFSLWDFLLSCISHRFSLLFISSFLTI